MRAKWDIVKLGDHVYQETEAIGVIDGYQLPVYGVTNVHGVTITGKDVSSDLSKYIRLKPSRLVYNPYRVNVGSLGLSSDDQDGIASPAYVIFSTRDSLDPKYLYYYLKSADGNRQINFWGNRGTVRQALRFVDLCKIEVPFPSIDEQKRIVLKIESLMAWIEEVASLRAEISIRLRLLFQAMIESTIDSTVKLGEISSVLSDRPRNGYSVNCDNLEGGTPVLTLTAITGFTYKPDYKLTSEPVDPTAHYWLNPGDLLISRSNTLELVGHAAIYSGEPYPCIYPDLAMKLPIDEKKANRKFVFFWLQTPTVREYIISKAKGTSPTMKKISQTIVMSIPFPSKLNIDKQHRIVTYLESLQDKVHVLKTLQTEMEKEIKELVPSIFDKAFKGEL